MHFYGLNVVFTLCVSRPRRTTMHPRILCTFVIRVITLLLFSMLLNYTYKPFTKYNDILVTSNIL